MSTKSRKGKTIGRPARHGGYSLLTRGVLPEKRKYIGHYLTGVREGLIHDLAGIEEGLSTAQKVLIDRIVTFLGVVRLIEEFAREHGIMDSRGRLTSGLTGHYLSFNRHIKDCLALLGLDKRQADVCLSPAEIAAAVDAEMAEKDKVEHVPEAEDAGQVQGEAVEAGPAGEGKAEGGGDA